jgi:LysM repeat protein
MSKRIATVIPSDGLRVRAAPSTSADILGALEQGEQVTITGRSGPWRAVDTRFGAGFVHGDFITVDGAGPVNEEPPGLDDGPSPSTAESAAGLPATVTVVAGDTLSVIGARLGIDFHAIAALNGISQPFTIRVGQVLRIPGGSAQTAAAATVTAASAGTAPAGTIDVMNPLVFDGKTLVTSSSNQGHHTPFGGNRSCDLDIVGASTPGTHAAFNLGAPSGVELRGVVDEIGLACASGRLADGGHKVKIAIQQRPSSGGDWQDTEAWVLYAHVDPVLVDAGATIANGTVVGALGPPAGGEYDSSCAGGSHTHVEAPGAISVLDEGTRIAADAVMRIRL